MKATMKFRGHELEARISAGNIIDIHHTPHIMVSAPIPEELWESTFYVIYQKEDKRIGEDVVRVLLSCEYDRIVPPSPAVWRMSLFLTRTLPDGNKISPAVKLQDDAARDIRIAATNLFLDDRTLAAEAISEYYERMLIAAKQTAEEWRQRFVAATDQALDAERQRDDWEKEKP